PISGTKLSGIFGSSVTVAGFCASVATTKPPAPSTVHRKNCKRSGAKTPPVVMKSPGGRMHGPGALDGARLRSHRERRGARADAEQRWQPLRHARQHPHPLHEEL